MDKIYRKDEFSLLRLSVEDEYNTRTWTEISGQYGRIKWGSHLITNIEGEEVVSAGMIMVDKDLQVTHSDKIKISGVKYKIGMIQLQKDWGLNSYQEIHIL